MGDGMRTQKCEQNKIWYLYKLNYVSRPSQMNCDTLYQFQISIYSIFWYWKINGLSTFIVKWKFLNDDTWWASIWFLAYFHYRMQNLISSESFEKKITTHTQRQTHELDFYSNFEENTWIFIAGWSYDDLSIYNAQ